MSNKPDLSHIAKDLWPLAVETKTLTYDPANARTGHALEDLKASLRVYGQRTPIVVNVDENNKVEKGNGTLRAAIELGWKYIAAVKVKDDPVTATGYAIADNRLSDLSYFDMKVLSDLLAAIPDDLDIPTGFDDSALDELLLETTGDVLSFLDDDTQETDVDDLSDDDDLAYKEVWTLKIQIKSDPHFDEARDGIATYLAANPDWKAEIV